MSPWPRLASALALLSVFAWTLVPRASGDDTRDTAVEAWIAASGSRFAAEDWTAALEPTRALVERFPTQQVYADRLARIYAHLGKPVQEAAAWEQFVKSAATPEDACPALPQAYQRAGDENAALGAFERCRDFDPSSAEGWFFLGQAYRRAGRDAESVATFRNAVRVDPQHADSRVGLAGGLLRAGEAAEALAVIEPMVSYDPLNADVHLMRGLALLRLDRRVDARASLERAHALDDDYVDVLMALGMLEYADGRMPLARGHFTRAASLAPERERELAVWLARTEPAR